MANWNSLKSAISEVITSNGNQEITGQLLQHTLLNIVNSVGENATFVGLAVPSTNPGIHDGPVFYLASGPGTYASFAGIVVNAGEVACLKWDGAAWSKVAAKTVEVVNDLVTGGVDKALSAEMGKVLKNGLLPVLHASYNMLNNAQHTGVYIIENVEDSPGKSTYFACFVRRSSTKLDDYAYCIEQVIYSLDESIPEVFSRIGFVTEDGVEFGNWNTLDTTSLKESSYDQGSSYEVGIIKSADGYRSSPLEKIFFSGTLFGITASSATATLQVSENYLMPYSLQGSVLIYKEDGSFQIYLLKDMEQLVYEFTIEDGILLLRLDAFPIFDTMPGISRVQYFVEVATTGLNVLP